MSRCFPFPPPGYEKEARTFDLELLRKEKGKKRKQKKEKKNREKKEAKDKEKKDKERSGGNHRDKKEKKDTPRDKKEKDRDKDKDKSTLDDNRLSKQVERISVDKASGEKKLRIPGRSEANTGEISRQKGREKELDRSSLSGDKKTPLLFSGYSERASQNNQSTEPPNNSKLHQADRGIRNEVRASGKASVEKFTSTNARNDEGLARLVGISTGTLSNCKEEIKTSEDKKSDDQVVKNGLRSIGNVTSQSFPGIVQPRIDKTSKALEKVGNKRVEGKVNSKKRVLDDGQGDKSKEKVKERNKEKKKEEKAKQKSQKKEEPDKLKETGKDDTVTGICNAKNSPIPEESIKNPITEGNPKKRKELDMNGFLSANDIKPNKVPKPSSHPLTQNGRVSRTPSLVPVGWQGAVNKLQTDGKEHRINGMMDSLASTISTAPLPSIPMKPLITVMADPLTELSRKLPHPDSKYLSAVLTVPKMEEWSDYDEQEWLFQGSDSQSKKPEVGTFEADEIPQVWSEALRLESSDICVLPYVIPY